MTKKSDAPAIRFKGFSDAWEQRKLSEMCGTFEYGLNAAAKEFDGKNKYIRITDIDDASREFLLSDLSSPDICLDGMSKYLLSSGDIVFARTGASVGKTYIYRENDGIVYFAGFLIRAKVNQDNDAEFVFQSTLSPSYEKYIRITSQRSGQPGVNAQEYGEYDLFAPSKEEQQRIGHFLRGIANLITLHQRKCIFFTGRAGRLISTVNKKRITSSWEQRKLGEMGQTYTGLSGKTKDDFGHGQARFVTYMNVFSNPISNPEMTEPIEIDPKQNEVEVGDVFFTTSSETPEEVGMSSILLEKRGKTYLNSFCFGFRPSEKIDSYYLAYMLRSESTRAKIILLAQGISRYNISKNKVMEIAVSLPSLDEQKMIGQYFSQLDNLITLHQRKCVFLFGFFQAFISMIFTASTFSWEQRKLSEIADKVTEKNSGLQYVETFTNSAEFGIISQRDFFDHDIAKLSSLDGYYIVKNEDFVYNPRISTSAPVGPINRNKLGRTGVMSPLYTVFRPHDVDTTYLEHFFKCAYWHSFMNFNGDSGARSDRFSIKNDVFFQMPIPLPHIDEQRKIGELLTCLDHLITLHQRKPFLMKWRTSDANRNQTNRLVL